MLFFQNNSHEVNTAETGALEYIFMLKVSTDLKNTESGKWRETST